jgi:hypothetical protein
MKGHIAASDKYLETLETQLSDLNKIIGEDTRTKMTALQDMAVEEKQKMEEDQRALEVGIAALAEMVSAFGKKRAHFLGETMIKELGNLGVSIGQAVEESLRPARDTVVESKSRNSESATTLKQQKQELKNQANDLCEAAQSDSSRLRAACAEKATEANVLIDGLSAGIEENVAQLDIFADSAKDTICNRFGYLASEASKLCKENRELTDSIESSLQSAKDKFDEAQKQTMKKVQMHPQLHQDFTFDHATVIQGVRDHLIDISAVEIVATGSTPSETATHEPISGIPEVLSRTTLLKTLGSLGRAPLGDVNPNSIAILE